MSRSRNWRGKEPLRTEWKGTERLGIPTFFEMIVRLCFAKISEMAGAAARNDTDTQHMYSFEISGGLKTVNTSINLTILWNI